MSKKLLLLLSMTVLAVALGSCRPNNSNTAGESSNVSETQPLTEVASNTNSQSTGEIEVVAVPVQDTSTDTVQISELPQTPTTEAVPETGGETNDSGSPNTETSTNPESSNSNTLDSTQSDAVQVVEVIDETETVEVETGQETTGQETTGQEVQVTANEGYHEVVAGDNLYAISVRYGTTVETLVELNAIADPTQLQIGQRIILPSN